MSASFLKPFILPGIFALLFSAPMVLAATATVAFSPAKPLQGDTVMMTVKKTTSPLVSATFDGKPVAVFKYKGATRAVIGIAASKAPGKYPVVLRFKDGTKITRTLTVGRQKFHTVKIGIPDKVGVTPEGLSAELAKEKQNLDQALAMRTSEVFFAKRFIMPLRKERKPGRFGDIRDTAGSIWRHLGVDFGAPEGTPVMAMNDGVVRKAYVDTIYGNTVVLDHGQGIFSMYLHLKEFRVTEGEMVRQGRTIGLVGDTGYSTAPHLHLTVKANGVSIDPVKFVAAFR